MGIALWCVWAAFTTAEPPEMAVPAPDPPEVAAEAAEPPEQGRAETFGGAGAQSIKGAHGTQLLIGLCSLLICASKWMLLY